MAKPIEEARLVDLTDEELKEFVGGLWEAVKNLTEAMGSDATILRLEEELKAYKDEHYKQQISEYKSKLKAGRLQVKVRGLKFKLPEDFK